MTQTPSSASPSDTSTEAKPDAVVIFAPLPVLTVTVENRSGSPDIHVHAGGQGVWQSRMVSSLGVPVVLCAALGGETGDVLGHLLPIPDVTAHTVPVSARNGSYVHDRRSGSREIIAESPGIPLDRHGIDSLYELTLTEGLQHGWVLLSGPQEDDVIPADLYRRLATDLGANGCKVAADLSGERLEAVLGGNPCLIKVSHEELLDDGRAKSEDAKDLVAAMRAMRKDGAGTVVVSRSGAAPALALPATPAAADALLDEYRVAPDTLKTDVRKGCFLYFAAALLAVAATVVILYFLLPRTPPAAGDSRPAPPSERR